MQYLLDYSTQSLSEILEQIALKDHYSVKVQAYRSQQILEWVYKKGIKKISEMSNIPLEMRNLLTDNFQIYPLHITEVLQSRDKEAEKYLFQTTDNRWVEAVRIIHPERNTLCISSMVGCPLGCQFCATSYLENKRNLSTGEIISQFLLLYHEKPVQNVVFMGMGEPLLNLENVLEAMDYISEPKLLNFSRRRFTISTAGIISGIEKLITTHEKAQLAVSLNSPFQEERENIMPVTRSNRLEDLFSMLKKYNDYNGRFTFEYIVLPGVNDSHKHAEAIIRLRKRMDFNLNVIMFNGFSGSPFSGATREEVKRFLSYFHSTPVEAVERLSKGADIAAGCGQLAARKNI